MSFRLELEPEDLRQGDGASVRRWGMIVLVLLMVMAGSAAGLWAAYRVIGHHGAGGTVPLLRADERPVKVPPANPGGLEVPDQDTYILNRDRPVDSRVEQLLPSPETPLPRPTPTAPTVTESPAPPAAPAAPAPLPPAIAAPAAAPAAAPVPAAATAPPPTVVAPAATAAPPPVKAATGAGYRLQVGAVRSPEAAQQEWAKLKRSQADLLGALGMDPQRIDRGASGVFYRIIAGPIADAAMAERACDELKRRKVGCILVKP